jgi:hypothetical protein
MVLALAGDSTMTSFFPIDFCTKYYPFKNNKARKNGPFRDASGGIQ